MYVTNYSSISQGINGLVVTDSNLRNYFTHLDDTNCFSDNRHVKSWLSSKNISRDTLRKLNQERIQTTSDLTLMGREDIVGLRLCVGEEVRLRSAIEQLRQGKRK